MAGECCSTGCLTKDHTSFAECLRAKHVGSMFLGGTGSSYLKERKFCQDTDNYRELVRQGGSISTAVNKGLDTAYREIGQG